MVDFDMLLNALYQIQGASDPNHPPGTALERLSEIYDTACVMMNRSGWQPNDREVVANTHRSATWYCQNCYIRGDEEEFLPDIPGAPPWPHLCPQCGSLDVFFVTESEVRK